MCGAHSQLKQELAQIASCAKSFPCVCVRKARDD